MGADMPSLVARSPLEANSPIFNRDYKNGVGHGWKVGRVGQATNRQLANGLIVNGLHLAFLFSSLFSSV